MTENNQNTDTSLITHDDRSITMNRPRQLVALNAAWEIEGIAKHLLTLLDDTTTKDMRDLVKRGLCVRIRDLANVVNHAIDPGGDTLEQLQAKVGMKPN